VPEPTSARLNIDHPQYRGRFWSLGDSPLIYYLTSISEARAKRQQGIDRFLRDHG